MFDLDAAVFHLRPQVDAVLAGLRAVTSDLPEMLIVGAVCRDALHHGYADGGRLPATKDFDLGVAVPDMATYERLVQGLRRRRAAYSGIQYDVAGLAVDLMPFGPEVESPTGDVTPRARGGDSFSVFGFAEVYEAAHRLEAADGVPFRCPDAAGFAALKLKAWVDRWPTGEFKDAGDLALAASWYVNDDETAQRLYSDDHMDILASTTFDGDDASVRLLVRDAMCQLGRRRAELLMSQWVDVQDAVLDTYMHRPGVLPRSLSPAASIRAEMRRPTAPP